MTTTPCIPWASSSSSPLFWLFLLSPSLWGKTHFLMQLLLHHFFLLRVRSFDSKFSCKWGDWRSFVKEHYEQEGYSRSCLGKWHFFWHRGNLHRHDELQNLRGYYCMRYCFLQDLLRRGSKRHRSWLPTF